MCKKIKLHSVLFCVFRAVYAFDWRRVQTKQVTDGGCAKVKKCWELMLL